jgi:hypothetical protein
MSDGDRFGTHQNLLDEKSYDFSATDQIQALCIALQSSTEIAEGVNYA